MISEASLITIIGMVGGGCGTLLVYFLKSRCTEIECCCMRCKRDVIREVSATLHRGATPKTEKEASLPTVTQSPINNSVERV